MTNGPRFSVRVRKATDPPPLRLEKRMVHLSSRDVFVVLLIALAATCVLSYLALPVVH